MNVDAGEHEERGGDNPSGLPSTARDAEHVSVGTPSSPTCEPGKILMMTIMMTIMTMTVMMTMIRMI